MWNLKGEHTQTNFDYSFGNCSGTIIDNQIIIIIYKQLTPFSLYIY